MAQDLLKKKKQYLTEMVQATKLLLASYANLRQLRQEWDSMGYSGTISQADIDQMPELLHLTPTILGDAWNAYDVINTLIATTGGTLTPNSGYLTNLYKMEP